MRHLKTVLITGATGGIGRATAEKLASDGYSLVLTGRSMEKLRSLSRTAKAATLASLAVDLLEDGAPEILWRSLAKSGHLPTRIVHCVGGTLDVRDPWAEPAAWRTVYRLNFESPMEVNRFALSLFRKRGFGRIVHLSSVAGAENLGPAPYCAAKAALNAYIRSMGRIVSADGVVVTGVSPGAVFTEDGPWGRRFKREPRAVRRYLREQTPQGRFARPEEIAEVIAFACSEGASQLAGCVIPCDGGLGRAFI